MNTDFIKGVVVPILTPIDGEERIDEARLRDQVDYVIDGGGYICDSTDGADARGAKPPCRDRHGVFPQDPHTSGSGARGAMRVRDREAVATVIPDVGSAETRVTGLKE